MKTVLFDLTVLLGDGDAFVPDLLPALGQVTMAGYAPVVLVDTRLFERSVFVWTKTTLERLASSARTPVSFVFETDENRRRYAPPTPIMALVTTACTICGLERQGSFLVIGKSRRPCPQGTPCVRLVALDDSGRYREVASGPDLLSVIAALGEKVRVA